MQYKLVIAALVTLPVCSSGEAQQRTENHGPYDRIPPLCNQHAFDPIQFSGALTCGAQTYQIQLDIEDAGPFQAEDFHDPCRSGSGRCNEQYKRDFARSRHITGKLILRESGGPALYDPPVTVTGSVLTWRPGYINTDLCAPIEPDGFSAKPNRKFNLQGFPIPGGKQGQFTSLQIMEFTHRNSGKHETSSQVSTPICKDVAMKRTNTGMR